MLGYGPSIPLFGPDLAYDAAMSRQRRNARDEDDPFSALRAHVEPFMSPDEIAKFDLLLESLVNSIRNGMEEDTAQAELERLAEIGKRAEQSGDRRPGRDARRASDSALTPRRIDEIARQAAGRRAAEASASLVKRFPGLARIRHG